LHKNQNNDVGGQDKPSVANMKPVFFSGPTEFRKWLEENHSLEKELIVGFHKVNSGKPSMTWEQSVEQALCFGWIDGIRKPIDETSYSIRFTPRKPGSYWSRINLDKAEELARKGLMHPAGIKAFEKRNEAKSAGYRFENLPDELPADILETFMANEKAWTYYSTQAPSYRRNAIRWIMSAKQDATILERLKKLIRFSESGKRVY
jgi:uncharacterized protein YdeI (YjbR/CyaY-like superfamily)